jgi:protein-tyrosine phosphatase
MVDIHCHILPEVDDGARSWDIAVEMCRMAAADGITHMVATPHANDKYAYDRDQHEATARELMERTGGAPEISVGCDFHFSYENVQEALVNSSPYTIGRTRYMLVEFSDYSIPPMFLNNLHQFTLKGLRLVITHPERNPLLQRRPEQLLEWVEHGAIIQVTANSLSGYWGKTAQNVARSLLESEAVHIVATDAHDLKARPPLLSRARRIVADWMDEEVADALVTHNPAAIIRNEELPFYPTGNDN